MIQSAEERLLELRKATQKAAERGEAAREAKDSLIHFMRLTMPDPNDPDDVSLSKYQVTPQARLLCQIMEKVERREIMSKTGARNVAISIGPQTGKSQIISRAAPAWMAGRNPALNAILGSYNQDFANEFGDDVRSIVNSPAYKQVFPEYALRGGGKAKDLLISTKGGKMAFVGVGGSGTGKPADVFVVDDPIRNDDDAQSEVYRERMWNWFTKVVSTRIHNESAVVVVHCMAGDTNVLLADGSTKLLRDIRRGDSVATYKDGGLSTSTVLNWANQGPDRVFTIKTALGAVTANGRHPFLVERNAGVEWVKLRDLKIGDKVLRAIGESGKASPAPTTAAARPPSAGGTASRTTIKFGGQTGNDRLHRTQGRVGRPICAIDTELTSPTMTRCSSPKEDGARSAKCPRPRTCAPTGAGSSASITATTPALSEACCATTVISQSDTGKQSRYYSLRLDTYAIAPDVILEIVEAGEEDVFDIQVDGTENFIANGLVSHNTRWHEDDLIGRLCDPDHPERNKKYAGIADDWLHINIPAVVHDQKLADALGLTLAVPQDPLVRAQFGVKPIAALWPQRFSLPFLAKQKRLDKRGFTALRMGRPSPEDGEFFKTDDIVEYYSMDELPKRLEMYGSSDHAVTEKRKNDASVIGCVGVDENDDIWIMPDVVWDRMETDGIVEALISQFKAHKPLLWWLEDENISKSFGPFLRKRMIEENTYVALDGIARITDKRSHARSIQGRMQMRKVHFPAFAPWWGDAKNELLKFPYGSHDDFVDFIANVGQGMNKQTTASKEPASDNVVRVGSIAWMLAETKRQERAKKAANSRW